MEAITAIRCKASVTAVAAIISGMQFAAVPPAAAQQELLGLEVITASLFDRNSPKVVFASCSDPRKVVIGGGGLAEPADARFTGLQPLSSLFIVTAERPLNLIDQTQWFLTAYAICINRRALNNKYTIISHVETPSSRTFQTSQTASCPPGTVAYSAGGAITTPPVNRSPGRMGLQLVRTDGRLGIGRVTAREDVIGFNGNWGLTSWAVCAPPLGMIHAEAEIPRDPLATVATHRCSGNNFVFGVGGGGGLIDGGPTFLRTLAPFDVIHGAPTSMVAMLTKPLNRSVGGMVAHPSCALVSPRPIMQR